MPRSKLKNGMAIVFGSLMLSMMMPAMLGSSTTTAMAQPIPPPGAGSQGSVDVQGQLPMQDGFTIRVLASNFSSPHNILYGPDGALWITERLGKNITRVDPDNGERLSTMEVPGVWQSEGQDGLMGMAFDPDFNSTGYIYVAYTYNSATGEDVDRRTKITRFTYDEATGTLREPFDLISDLHASIDHNSGRLIFGPDEKLYYTIGDQGNNQFSRYCFDIRAQALPTEEEVAAEDWGTYQGKTLRMNPDGSIPEDNPEINGVISHIFTYGHRNHQGIAVGSDGDLYAVEHGDKSDDEFNHLQAGGNFGWPYVAGFRDDKAYQYVNWSAAENCEDLDWSNIAPPPPGVPVMNESEFQADNFVEPVATFYTVETGYNFSEPADCGYVCWPTVAPSSLRLYTSDAIPDWNGTFLMTTLKGGRIFHLTLNEDGTALEGDPVELFRSENRYRDLAFGPDGTTIYVITDSFGPAQNIEGGATEELWTPGSLLLFTYSGNNNNNNSTAGP